MEHVAILGASSKQSRYAYRAQQQLAAMGYTVSPVSNHEEEVLGESCFRSLCDIESQIDTVTIYLNPLNLAHVVGDLLASKPRRAIFNPGSESLSIMRDLEAAGIEVQSACTLVLLSTGQFDQDG